MKNPIRATALALCLFAAACAAEYRNHGYVPNDEDLANVIVGIDTRDSVIETVGAPTAGGVLNESGLYYVRSRVRTFGPFRPTETERQLVAVTFDQSGVVANIERFGLEDGRVVQLSRRITDNGLNNISFIRQLLGNIGNFDAASALK
ncbi:outer membrane protein assembly factor BamE [Cognatishimia sp. WU-CL00825]|uniref:outer membrane protein assembly factor BamE n=1 Tax=Cognatishimia sp. WU-CL00825 TaxID=3127658 RepID=UPI003365A05F